MPMPLRMAELHYMLPLHADLFLFDLSPFPLTADSSNGSENITETHKYI
jgi:hypothetical protein